MLQSAPDPHDATLAETPVAAALVLPAGAAWLPDQLTLRNALGDWPVAVNGTAAPVVWAGGPQYAEAVNPSGDTYLVGWLGEGFGELSARSTAHVLLFFASGGSGLLPEHWPQALAFTAQGQALDDLAAAIEAALAGGASGLADALPALAPALADALTTLRSQRPAQAQKALINPPGVRSGLRVETPGTGVITIRNSYRRRATAYVSRIGYVPADGRGFVDTADPAQRISLEPTAGFGSLAGLVFDFLTGAGLYTDQVSGVIPVPSLPADAVKTRYEVCVVGPGLSFGSHFDNLSEEQIAELLRLWLRTAVFDVTLPILGNIVLPNGPKIKEAFGDPAVVDAVLGVVGALEKVPGLRTKVLGGDAKGFLTDVSKLVLEGALKDPIYDALRAWIISSTSGKSSLANINFIANGVLVLRAADAIGTGIDTAVQAYHIARSNEADRWEVDVLGSKVTLSPTSLRFVVGEEPSTQTLNAIVDEPAPPGQFYRYRWTNTENVGFLTVAGQASAPEVVTTQDVAAYSRMGIQTGADTVRVEVFIVEGGEEVLIGADEAQISVVGSDPRIRPATASVVPGSTAGEFRVTFPQGVTHPPLDDLYYRWSCAESHGRVARPPLGDLAHEHTALYMANTGVDTPQTETLTVEVYEVREGLSTLLGTSTATILIEDRVSILPATMRILTCPDPVTEGRSYIAAVVDISPPLGAKTLRLVGTDGNDPAYYGTSISIGASRQTDGTWNLLYGGCPWEVLPDEFFFLSGGAGPAALIPGTTNTLQTRFGAFNFQVVVTYDD